MNKMFVRVDGITYDGWTSATASKSIGQAAGTFSFQTTSTETTNFPVQRGDKIDVFIDNIIIMSGFVDIVLIEYDAETHSITISGRDATGILIDSSVPGNRSFNPPIDLEQITNIILGRLGSTLRVVNDVPDLKKFKTSVEAKIEQTAFEFLEEYGRKANVMLTSNRDGDLVIYRSNPKKVDTILLHEIDNEENNILTGVISFDDSERFSKYTVYSQKEGSDDVSNKNQASTKGEAFDDGALSVKQKVMALESDGSVQDAKNRAAWEANIRRARSTSHTYTVFGFYHSRGLWDINLLTRVRDDYATIDSDMLIDSIQYDYSLDGGALTTIGVIGPDAYQVKASVTKQDKVENELTWKL